MFQMKSRLLGIICLCAVGLLVGCSLHPGSGGPSGVDDPLSGCAFRSFKDLGEVSRVSKTIIVVTLESSENVVHHGMPNYVDGEKVDKYEDGWDFLETRSRVRVDEVIRGDLSVGDVVVVPQVRRIGDDGAPVWTSSATLPDLKEQRFVLFLREPFHYRDAEGDHEDQRLVEDNAGTWVVKDDGTVIEAFRVVLALESIPYPREFATPSPDYRSSEEKEWAAQRAEEWAVEYAKHWPSTLDQLEQMVAEAPPSPR